MPDIQLALRTERLYLRPLRLTDAERIAKIVNHPTISRNTLRIPYPYTLDDAVTWITANVEQLEETGIPETFAVVLKQDDIVIGAAGLHEHAFGRAEIGYWLGEVYWGRGYMTEVAQRLLQYGFEERNLNRIQATYFSWNIASHRVMEKAGMTYEGMMRGYFLKDGESIDVGMCGVTRADWEAQRA